MGIFDMIIDKDYRINFLNYKLDRLDKESLRDYTKQYILSEQCEKDIIRLKNGDYFFSLPTKKLIPKTDSNKKRILYMFPENEVALMRLIAYAFQNMEELYTNSLYSFRINRGAKEYAHERKTLPQLDNYYAIKVDIKSYANTLSSNILADQLQKIFSDDPEMCNFLVWFVKRGQYTYNGEIINGETAGLPGCPLYAFFGNVYLFEVDSYFENKGIEYARYADDILIYAKTLEEATKDYNDLSNILEKLKLQFNKNKTRIIEPGQPVEFLGILYGNGWIDISRHTLNKIESKMRGRAKIIEREKRLKGLNAKQAAKLMVTWDERVFSGQRDKDKINWLRWFFPVITRTDGLNELDRYNQYCIRYVMTGKWNKAQYRVSYDTLKKMGYRSLVRMYYSGSLTR